MNMIFVKEARDEPWGRNVFLGDPDLNQGLLSSVDDNELFLMQVNLENFRFHKASILLPKSGFLYFFLNADTLEGKVRYRENVRYDKYLDARVEFNEMHQEKFDLSQSYHVHFRNGKTKFRSQFLIENSPRSDIEEDEIILFQYDNRDTPFLSKRGDMTLSFVISREALLNRDYRQVRTIISRNL